MRHDYDPFDEFLLHCSSEQEEAGRLPRTPEAWQPLICPDCQEEIKAHFRFCSNCGAAVTQPDGEGNPYDLPRRERGRLFEVTLVGISQDVISNGESRDDEDDEGDTETRLTVAHLRIRNRTSERLCLSLTFAPSVLIDLTSQQHLPVLREEGDLDSMFDGWFYLYPGTWVEGTLVFPDPGVPLQQIYISCQPQDREEDLFHFPLR